MSAGTTDVAAEAGGAGPDAGLVEGALATVTGRLSGRWVALWSALTLAGLAAFLVAVAQEPARAWGTAWANYLFWTSLAVSGVLFGAVLQTAKGHWGKEFRRLGEGMGAFLPLALVIFFPMVLLGADYVFPWRHPLPDIFHINPDYLTLDGLLLRNGVGLVLLFGAAFVYLHLSLRPDAPLVADRLRGWRRRLVAWLGRGWRGDEEELERARRRLSRFSPAFILVFALVLTVLSVDLAMSLVPGFISIIWGAYFFMGGWLAMLALMAVLVCHYNRRLDLSARWGKWQFHDLGKLIFAFAIFWAYLWWSQYLVIWYGNLARETIFFEQRLPETGFALYWWQMILVFGIPFLLLLGRKPKMNPTYVSGVALVVLAGLWLERHLLVGPSVLEGTGFTLTWVEFAVSAGFLGLFGLCYATFASIFPKVPIRETLVGDAGKGP